MANGCGFCGSVEQLCPNCHRCLEHCACAFQWAPDDSSFDADELGLDPETDNTPGTGERHA